MKHRKALRQMQLCVQQKRYITKNKDHVDEELDNDSFSPSDMRLAILNGGITKRLDDEEAGGYQYHICGRVRDGREMLVVARLEEREGEKWLVIITVWDTKKERGDDLQEQ